MRRKVRYSWFLWTLLGAFLSVTLEVIIGRFPQFYNALTQNSAFLAAFLGVLSLIIGLLAVPWYFPLRRNKRELSWSIISNTAVLNSEAKSVSDIQVLIANQPVFNARIIVLKLWNSGNIAVQRTDYEQPITFSFGEGVQVVSAGIIDVEPPDIPVYQVPLTLEAESVAIIPLLLNSQDSITFQVVLAGEKVEVNASARVVGLAGLKFKKQTSPLAL